MTQVPAPARDATWDVARGIGMSLVIYGHFLEPVYPARPAIGHAFVGSAFTQWQWIYSFHMMLFFFVSGAVNRSLPKKPWADALRGSLRLLALAWIVHLLGMCLSVAIGNAPEATRSVWQAAVVFFDPIVEGFLWSVGVLWFLSALCCVQLLAWFSLRWLPALAVVALAVAGTAVVVYCDAPNQYMLRTWMPGLSFFALAWWCSTRQLRWPPWLSLPLLLATIWLAPRNDGCAITLHNACETFGSGPFGVRMFGGAYGFLPMFFITAATGTLSVVCLAAGIARSRVGALFAHMGRNSLELFIINGFVATFLPPYVSRLPLSGLLNPPGYLLLAVTVIGLHLAALALLKPALARIDAAALALAGVLSRALARSPAAGA